MQASWLIGLGGRLALPLVVRAVLHPVTPAPLRDARPVRRAQPLPDRARLARACAVRVCARGERVVAWAGRARLGWGAGGGAAGQADAVLAVRVGEVGPRRVPE